MQVTIKDISDFYEIFPQFKGKISVKTRFGYKPIEEAGITAKQSNVYKVTTTSDEVLLTSPEHKLLSNDVTWIQVQNLKVGSILFKDCETTKIKSIKKLKTKKDLYDLQVAEVHEFFANGIVSHNSTILEALTFVLYGKSFRPFTKNQLINSINQKHLLVELYFEIGKKQYYVKRGIKPHIFEIYEDNKLLNQDPSIRDYQKVLEQQIIKMNYRAFTQVVIMGSSSYTPFMRLKTNDRREFIEDLLDIRVFSVMNALLKEKMKNLKEDVRDVEVELKSLREKAALQDKHVKSRKQEKKDTLLLLSNEIEVLIAENDRHQAACDDLMQDSSGLQTQTEKYENTSERMGEVKALHRRIEDNIKKHREKREFYDTVEHCPTCKQTIEDRHKTNIIGTVDEQITSLETDLQQLQVELSKVHADMQIYEDLSMKLNEINSEINKHNKMIMVNNALIESKKVQIIAEQDNTSNVDEEIAILKEYAKAIVAKSDKKKEIIELQQYQTACSVFLQDNGIKAKIIKQYIPIINKLINKYLDAMDFFVGFHLDENFNEIIKSRHRDTFSYESFSDGQKRRIDAALLLTWRDVAKSKNSVNTNLIFFDEFDAPLDGGGADMLMDLYKASNIQNVFIISHKEGLANHADRILRFEMNNNFTILKDD